MGFREIPCYRWQAHNSPAPFANVWALLHLTDDGGFSSVSQLPRLLAITWSNFVHWLTSPRIMVLVYGSLASVASNKYPGVSRAAVITELEWGGAPPQSKTSLHFYALSVLTIHGEVVIRTLLCAAVLFSTACWRGWVPRGHLITTTFRLQGKE